MRTLNNVNKHVVSTSETLLIAMDCLQLIVHFSGHKLQNIEGRHLFGDLLFHTHYSFWCDTMSTFKKDLVTGLKKNHITVSNLKKVIQELLKSI